VRLRVSLGAAALAIALGTPVSAQDASRGAALAEERNCGACHGPRGVSEIAGVPSLAGQQAEFVTLQLILFRENIRRVPAMAEAVRGLSDKQVEDLAAYVAALPPAQPPDRGPRDATLAERGAMVAAGRNCNACHLPTYAGQRNVPRINAQREDFLVHTLTEYRDGGRVGADTQMNGLMHGVTDADILALAHHLAHQE
jgi:cytochrome c553